MTETTKPIFRDVLAKGVLFEESTAFPPPLIESVEIEQSSPKRYCVVLSQEVVVLQSNEQEDG